MRLVIAFALVATGCDRLLLDPWPCAKDQTFCADFDTRERGELQFESHYEDPGTATYVRGPAVSPPNSFNAVSDQGATAVYAILQHELDEPGFHGVIDFWVASPIAAPMCRPYALYLRLDTEPAPMNPYQVQFQLGVSKVTTYVQAPSGMVSLDTNVADLTAFHRVRIEVDVAKQFVSVAIDEEVPRVVEGADLSGASRAVPELQIGIGLGAMHAACAVLIDDLAIDPR